MRSLVRPLADPRTYLGLGFLLTPLLIFSGVPPVVSVATVAAQVVGNERVDTDVAPVMGAEDFSFMLNARPGAFIFVGNGDSAGLHHPAYDFNDEVIPIGTSYWVKLVETAMAA